MVTNLWRLPSLRRFNLSGIPNDDFGATIIRADEAVNLDLLPGERFQITELVAI
jgi:hypothetical protein